MVRVSFQGVKAFSILVLFVSLGSLPTALNAQESSTGPVFTRITSGQIVTAGGADGAAWVDYDGDGDLDLSTVGNHGAVNSNQGAPRRSLYSNNGDGTFTKVTSGTLVTDSGVPQGLAWGDYDNDGDLDLLVAGVPTTLYKNNGSGQFSKVTTGDIATKDNRGWSPSWADYDNDGDLDLFITHPAGFVGSPSTANHFFRNDGPPSYILTKVTDSPIATAKAPFTVGSWSDYDLDGDQDLFIGSGPANGNTARDYFYQNSLAESGSANFQRIEDTAFAMDRRDGQVVNWIDIENDGDLDMYVTNWGGALNGIQNNLYRNDDGVYTKITEGAIVTDKNVSLANVWGDFDNDADIDVFVANQTTNRLYLNNGDGTFTRVTEGAVATDNVVNWTATIGDYDNDGDLDLFAPALFAGQQNLFYRNDLQNGNHWVKLRLVGSQSNRAGVGAKVYVTATINGQQVKQIREISTQNSFLGHNSFEVHVGLSGAEIIDLVRIEWPSGQVDEHESISNDQVFQADEGGNLTRIE